MTRKWLCDVERTRPEDPLEKLQRRYPAPELQGLGLFQWLLEHDPVDRGWKADKQRKRRIRLVA